MKRVSLTLPVLIVLSLTPLAAQTAAELERMLALPFVSYGDAARFVLGAAGLTAADISTEAAYRFAADKGWFPKDAAQADTLTLGGLSFLIMKALNIKGGLMYALFPGPRYAYRELLYRKIIRGRSYASMSVSGQRFLRILNRALEYAGDAVDTEPAAKTVTEAPRDIPLPDEVMKRRVEITLPDEGKTGNE